MSMNLTKLSNAEYPLRDAREAIDGDNALNPADPTAYYTATGNPPGYWIGKGAELVGGKVGTTASSKTVRELINERRNPSNGQYLGDVKLVEGDNGEAPVAGFDLTTRQPKSISILWAFGDKETRDGIDECMRRATEMTIEYFEKEYATTRAGQGGVASVSADGVAGFVFDHYDSRDGDPQPHEHVVLSNRVRRSSDKVWTALDGRKIYASLVEISEVHENLLQDLLTERFGWSWTLRQDTGTKAVVNEVEGVPQELIDAFSGRHAEIAKLVEEKIKEEERQTGKEVGPKRKAQIDLEVWRNTRKAKPAVQPSLQAKREHWYHKLGEVAPDIQLDQMMKDVNSHKKQSHACGRRMRGRRGQTPARPARRPHPTRRRRRGIPRPAGPGHNPGHDPRARHMDPQQREGRSPTPAPRRAHRPQAADHRREQDRRQGARPMRQTHTRPVQAAGRHDG